MNSKQAIKHLKELKECYEFDNEDNDDNVWKDDVQALEMAINELEGRK